MLPVSSVDDTFNIGVGAGITGAGAATSIGETVGASAGVKLGPEATTPGRTSPAWEVVAALAGILSGVVSVGLVIAGAVIAGAVMMGSVIMGVVIMGTADIAGATIEETLGVIITGAVIGVGPIADDITSGVCSDRLVSSGKGVSAVDGGRHVV